MSDVTEPDENETQDEHEEAQKVYDMDENADSAELPDIDFLGMTPGDANKETDPGDPPVPDGG